VPDSLLVGLVALSMMFDRTGDDWCSCRVSHRLRTSDAAPRTGQWFLDDHGQLHFRRAALDWHQLQEENECFWLRVYGPGDYRYKGASSSARPDAGPDS
jgi:hypothetical protein